MSLEQELSKLENKALNEGETGLAFSLLIIKNSLLNNNLGPICDLLARYRGVSDWIVWYDRCLGNGE
jgi:hypothetical protein